VGKSVQYYGFTYNIQNILEIYFIIKEGIGFFTTFKRCSGD
jgi:hypothetical protein